MDTPGTGSRIFENVRTLGRVSDNVPCILRYVHRRKLNLVISSAGSFFNTYQSQQLKLISVSESTDHTDQISSLAGDTYHVYTGSGSRIHAWRRGTELKHTYKGHGSRVILLLPLAQKLVSIDDEGLLIRWGISSEENEWSIQFNIRSFKPTTLMHPATYTNKILIGSEQGTLELWNIRKQAIVHRFGGWGSCIAALVQAPALNVVGIALAGRRILIYDLLHDSIIMSFHTDEPPTSLAFRTDGPPMLLVGLSSGTLTLYNLENKSIEVIKERAHSGPITGLTCFQQEPVFVTSSPDNALRVWIFDMPDGSFRLLNSREGHSLPPTRIRFIGHNSSNILSAGLDASLRTFHIYNETYNKCLSKTSLGGPAPLKRGGFKNAQSYSHFPPIIDFTTESLARPTGHDDLAAIHADQLGLSTWSLHDSKKGSKSLLLPKYKNIPVHNLSATTVCMSACGQFVIAGYTDGSLERFNIQSGAHRKSYGAPAHSGSVRGIAIDRLNTKVFSGSSSELGLKVWNFNTGDLFTTIPTDSSISFLFFGRNASLVGVALDGFEILVIDTISNLIFRRVTNIPDSILSASFSPDSRWLTASFADRSVRSWDLPTGRLIDAFLTDATVSSLDYSPNSEYLATALSNQLEILLWANKTLYIHISLMPLPDSYEPGLGRISTKVEEEDSDLEEEEEYMSPQQIHESLITLSSLPDSKWSCLLHLDTIEKRNKPREAAKTFVAPFFLSGLLNNADPHSEQLNMTQETHSESKLIKLGAPKSELSTLLDQYTLGKEEELIGALGRMRPKQLDLELRSLSPSNGGSIEDLKLFLTFLHNVTSTKRWFEAREAYLALFLKIHGETISANSSLYESLQKISQDHVEQTEGIQEEITSILGLIAFIKSNTV